MLDSYNGFVETLLSNPSKNRDEFLKRIAELYDSGCEVERLLTSVLGLASEAGELGEIVKKQIFQGKPYSAENVFHMKRELGDIIFYWMVACQALNIAPEEIILENISKLESRYPGGKFAISHSEVRKDGDL